MNQFPRDTVSALTWLIAIVGGAVAAWKALVELNAVNQSRIKALEERSEQFKWRKAEMARSVLDALWSDSEARDAMRMLDWSGRTYDRRGGTTLPISHPDMERALRTENTHFKEDEQYVRDCFDQLFDGMEKIEHYLQIELVRWDDVKGRMEYYVRLLSARTAVISKFLHKYEYKLAIAFLRRYPIWVSAELPRTHQLPNISASVDAC